jgi:DNA polymerase bacteriophage-type
MIGLDFETYGSRDLTKVGLHNYVDDPLFQPLVAVAVPPFGVAQVFDFIQDGHDNTVSRLADYLRDVTQIAAHNAGFERAVLKRIGIDIPAEKFTDTAVIAAYHGAGRSLEAAASQLLDKPKYAEGMRLIKKFCIPGDYQSDGNLSFNPNIMIEEEDDWAELIYYCSVDAELSLQLCAFPLPVSEQAYSVLSMQMNQAGWPIDLSLVDKMQRRYEDNLEQVTEQFVTDTGELDLNLASSTQLSKWCADRGVRASSFDEEQVLSMLTKLNHRLENNTMTDEKRQQYTEVVAMLRAKRDMGGSSLKKLEVMQRQATPDGRLFDSYLHFGAQATGRTTGRGVQMQNLPRLFGGGQDVNQLFDPLVHWDNRTMGDNLRQVFRATDPAGQLVVGDFSSVESRGLAWQADEKWKLDAYSQGQDLYKVLASRIYEVDYDSVTKDQRQVGKTGELSCGYGAGPGAVHAFAKNMGVDMTEPEAASLVRDWRAANPNIVEWWQLLQDALLNAVVLGDAVVNRPWGYVHITKVDAPRSLKSMGVNDSLDVTLVAKGLQFVRRIHGVEQQGRNLTYYKPSERKTGDLWTNQFTDPKTKQTRQFTVYGGKLAGLLTQSLCRELFFQSLQQLDDSLSTAPNATLIGQFHDEIVVEWNPGLYSLDMVIDMMTTAMTSCPLTGFPLDAEIKSAHRYIK